MYERERERDSETERERESQGTTEEWKGMAGLVQPSLSQVICII